jgi:hypothetical protein
MKRSEIKEQIEIIEKIFRDGVKKCEEGILDLMSATPGLELALNRKIQLDFSKLVEGLNYAIHIFETELSQVKNEISKRR